MPRAATQRPRVRALPADLRVGDLLTFFSVRDSGSVTGAARALGTSPSQVSKAIGRLEAQLRVVLLSRGVRGVSLTDEALRIVPHLERAMAHLQRVVSGDGEQPRMLTIAGPAFAIEMLLPTLVEAQPHLRVCALELPPAVLRAHVAENQFDLALITGDTRLPPAWHCTSIGVLGRALLARPALARKLGPPPVDVARLRRVPFITPVYSVNGQFVQADDDCPIDASERRLGHKVQTLRLALELATRIDQLVFGPRVGARAHLQDGRLVEVPVRGWRSTAPLALACNPERLLAREYGAIVEAARRALRDLA